MIILQGCRQGGGAEAVPDVKLMLYCVQDTQNLERKNSFQVISCVTYTKIKA